MTMVENQRVMFYRSLLEVYNCFNQMNYNNGIYILENTLKSIEQIIQELQNNYYNCREMYMNYVRRTMDYSRAIPKSNQSRQKRFIEWFHKAIFNISKNAYIHSYSYIRDMKTILEKLNDRNRAS